MIASGRAILRNNDAARKPLFHRGLHWAVALLFLIAFLTAYPAFDFTLKMRISTRDALFAIHRLSGLTAGMLILFWGFWSALRWARSRRGQWRLSIMGAFHVALGVVCVVLPTLPWIARSQDGRTAELYALTPGFNLVSHPTTPLTYKLLHEHKQLAGYVLVLLVLHICGALFHWLVFKDRVMWSMLFGRS